MPTESTIMSKISVASSPDLGDVADFQVVAAADRVDRVHPAADEAHAVLLFGAVVEAFEILAVGAHVHEEDGAVQILVSGVLLGDDRLLDGVHAADRGAVSVVALVHVPRADALEPGDFLRFLVVGQAHQVAARGAGGRQHALELHGGDHVRELGVVVSVELGGVKRAEAREPEQWSRLELGGLLLLVIEIDCACGAEFLAGAALALLQNRCTRCRRWHISAARPGHIARRWPCAWQSPAL